MRQARTIRGRRGVGRRGRAFALLLAGLLLATGVSVALATEGPPVRPDTRQVMFVGNNWEGTADIIDSRTYRRLARINTIPDKAERMREIRSDPERLAFFLAIRQFIGEGNDQYTDDMFTTHDGTLVAVSRPSFADVVGISLKTKRIVWRFKMDGQRSDHMGVSPDGKRLYVSDSTANKVHELVLRTGRKTGEYPSGDSPHETNFSKDGRRIFHASIGRVYTPTDRCFAAPLVTPLNCLPRDTSKGDRRLQIVDARSLKIMEKWDMGAELDEYERRTRDPDCRRGAPREDILPTCADMSAAVRPMAIAPGEKTVFVQVSFFHGFVEFDVERGRVRDVIALPKAPDLPPREQYLLDSAHHGLGINRAGTKLCAAGTMSDYAAIVRRGGGFPRKIASRGSKPYWSTTGPIGNVCWVSYSGDDEVAVIDYATEREVARIPVGDHPQRVRAGAINRSLLGELPDPPDEAPGGAGTIVGTPGDDVIRCRPGHNRVDGGGGNDTIHCGSGHDVVIGGPGNDRLYGGSGDDRLDGGPGDDLLDGDSGDDVLNGGPGRDEFEGGTGRNQERQ